MVLQSSVSNLRIGSNECWRSTRTPIIIFSLPCLQNIRKAEESRAKTCFERPCSSTEDSMGVFDFLANFSLARILAWVALAYFHQGNLWLFGCLYYVSLVSPVIYLLIWFVWYNHLFSKLVRLVLRHFVEQGASNTSTAANSRQARRARAANST